MTIISRAEAKQKGLKQYFTGAACKNGHIASRYTQSGTCSECVKAANVAGTPDPNKRLRQEAKAALVLVKVRAFSVDRDTLAASAYALSVSRYPLLQPSDVDPHLLPVHRESSGTALYSFYVHESDVPQLRGISNSLLNNHAAAIDKQKIMEKTAAYLPEDTTPPFTGN